MPHGFLKAWKTRDSCGLGGQKDRRRDGFDEQEPLLKAEYDIIPKGI